MARHKINPARPVARGPVPPPEPLGDEAHPTFAFHLTAPRFSIENLTNEQKAAFLGAIGTRSQMTWSQMRLGGRNRMGSHTIHRKAIRVAIPDHCTIRKEILSVSAGQGVSRFIGYRSGEAFVIVWFDPEGRVYKH